MTCGCDFPPLPPTPYPQISEDGVIRMLEELSAMDTAARAATKVKITRRKRADDDDDDDETDDF